jgi:hypothetical protein
VRKEERHTSRTPSLSSTFLFYRRMPLDSSRAEQNWGIGGRTRTNCDVMRSKCTGTTLTRRQDFPPGALAKKSTQLFGSGVQLNLRSNAKYWELVSALIWVRLHLQVFRARGAVFASSTPIHACSRRIMQSHVDLKLIKADRV